MSDSKTEDFYKRLKKQLEGDASWPAPYLYKFIVPAENQKVAEIEVIFDGMDAEIVTRDSSNVTYTSISIKVTMTSAEDVSEK